MSGIYIIQNTLNKNLYIGSAVDLKQREHHHRYYLRNGTHSNMHLQRGWNKYTEECFTFWIAEKVLDKNQLLAREQWWLDMFKPEYNICKIAGSTLGRKLSSETKAKISSGNRGKCTGKNLSTEHKMKISAANLGRKSFPRTTEYRTKLSIAMSGKNVGKKASLETRAKMSAAHLGKKRPLVSAETRIKMSLAQMNNKNRLGKKVFKILTE